MADVPSMGFLEDALEHAREKGKQLFDVDGR